MSADSEPLPEATQTNNSDTPITDGVYLVANKHTRTRLDLVGARTEHGAQVYACYYIEVGGFTEQLWKISSVGNNRFTFCNIGSAKVLDFKDNGEVGKRLECKSREEGSARQHWELRREDDHFYSIQNIQFADRVIELNLKGKALDECNEVTSARYNQGSHYQQWSLERRSRSVSEVQDLVDRCPILQEMPIAWPSTSDICGFIVVRDHRRDSLMKESGLMKQVFRRDLFDDKAFALKLKDTVQTWCAKHIRIVGYAILFGVICGSANAGSKAYNWYLTDDLCEIVFLDPLDGRELTAKGLQKKGFRPEWAIC